MNDEEQLKERTEEIVDAKVPDALKADPTPDVESPLEEARKLKKEMKKISEDMTREREIIEKHRAEMMLSGRSIAGQKPETQEEKDKAEADEIIRNYLG